MPSSVKQNSRLALSDLDDNQ
jgi:hypothetical protein